MLLLGCAGSAVPRSKGAESVAAPSEAVVLAGSDCRREREQAFALSDAGDRLVKTDVGRAVESYTQAIALYPKEHRIFWKLALVYVRAEDWRRAESTLTRAVQLAPSFANYWFQIGNVVIRLAEDGEPGAFERAKLPLKRCIEVDASFAECHHLLGEAYEQTNDERSALLEYSRAIELNPSRGFFYGPLADLYTSLGLYQEAKVVLNEGARLIPNERKNYGSLYNVHVLLARLATFEKDRAGQLKALAMAEDYLGEDPVALFNLGSTYAAIEPPLKERATRLLSGFLNRACRGGAAGRDSAEQCRLAKNLLERLGDP